MRVGEIYQDLYNKRLALVRSGVDSYWLSEGLRTGITHQITISGRWEVMKRCITLLA